MEQFDHKRLGWTDICCICGRHAVCYHNPDPLREDNGENCCDACNRLVIAARKKIWQMAEGERAQYVRMLRNMPYESLKKTLYPT